MIQSTSNTQDGPFPAMGDRRLPADVAILNHEEVVARLRRYSLMTPEEKFGNKTEEQIRNFSRHYDALCYRLTEILEGRG